MIELEKGIPAPTVKRPGRSLKWPWFKMCHDIGDSFFVPDKTPRQMSCYKRYWEKKLGWAFSTRSEEKGGEKGTRVWRVE